MKVTFKFLKNWYQLPLFGDLSSNKNFKSLYENE